jgi:excisionase family DNA binding protein
VQTGAESPEAVVADGLVSIPEAAEFLGLSRSNLYTMMERGELAYAKIGGARRIPRKALVGLAARCLRGGGEA